MFLSEKKLFVGHVLNIIFVSRYLLPVLSDVGCLEHVGNWAQLPHCKDSAEDISDQTCCWISWSSIQWIPHTVCLQVCLWFCVCIVLLYFPAVTSIDIRHLFLSRVLQRDLVTTYAFMHKGIVLISLGFLSRYVTQQLSAARSRDDTHDAATSISCDCGFWTSMGLPCRHIFRRRLSAKEDLFAGHLVLRRWQKIFYLASYDITSTVNSAAIRYFYNNDLVAVCYDVFINVKLCLFIFVMAFVLNYRSSVLYKLSSYVILCGWMMWLNCFVNACACL